MGMGDRNAKVLIGYNIPERCHRCGGANGRSTLCHGLRPQPAKDQAIWSPGINVGKPIEMSDMCVLIKHREQWLLWDTGYPDAVADRPIDTPVGHATRAKKLITQLGELGVKPADI